MKRNLLCLAALLLLAVPASARGLRTVIFDGGISRTVVIQARPHVAVFTPYNAVNVGFSAFPSYWAGYGLGYGGSYYSQSYSTGYAVMPHQSRFVTSVDAFGNVVTIDTLTGQAFVR